MPNVNTSIIDINNEAAISWSAILGGAAASIAVSLALMVLGAGLGLMTASPWTDFSSAAADFTVKAAIWLVFTQWIASVFGGYIAGRLRTIWRDVNSDEIYFRDTAHGFLVWAVATALTAAVFTTTISSIVGTTTQAVAITQAQEANTTSLDPIDYYVDGLTRAPRSVVPYNEGRAEIYRLLARNAPDGALTPADRDYLIQLVSVRGNMSDAEATARVDKIAADMQIAKLKAEEARKDAAKLSTLLFLSFLVGAFAASLSATYGGKHRDD